jgi:hypothetical protein
MSTEDILDTFEQYEDDLTGIFNKYKDMSQWDYNNNCSELVHAMEVTNVFKENQILDMIYFLERHFNCSSMVI